MAAISTSTTVTQKIGFDEDYLQAFEAKPFIEGEKTPRRLTNFFVLLLLATVIATYGVLSDSTATVIGAMIVAPLMGPIMATTAAVIMGSTNRALRSLGLVIAGVLSVIVLSYLLAFIVPDVTITYLSNAEITSRIQPGLFALLTALAAGAAGAFITSREEIADSMGGVAISISLVPPLCVVGISLNQGEWSGAAGAMLLFLTNFLAILLAGGLVFMLAGLGSLAVSEMSRRVRRRAYALIIVSTLIIAVPLSVTAYGSFDSAMDNYAASVVAREWLGDSADEILAVTVIDEFVTVSLEGSEQFPPVSELADELAKTLERQVVVNVRLIPAQQVASLLEGYQNTAP